MSRFSDRSSFDKEESGRHNSKKALTTALIFFAAVTPGLQEEYVLSEKSYIKTTTIYPAAHCCSELDIDISRKV